MSRGHALRKGLSAGAVTLAATGFVPLEALRGTVAQFPTFSEAYLKGVEALEP